MVGYLFLWHPFWDLTLNGQGQGNWDTLQGVDRNCITATRFDFSSWSLAKSICSLSIGGAWSWGCNQGQPAQIFPGLRKIRTYVCKVCGIYPWRTFFETLRYWRTPHPKTLVTSHSTSFIFGFFLSAQDSHSNGTSRGWCSGVDVTFRIKMFIVDGCKRWYFRQISLFQHRWHAASQCEGSQLYGKPEICQTFHWLFWFLPWPLFKDLWSIRYVSITRFRMRKSNKSNSNNVIFLHQPQTHKHQTSILKFKRILGDLICWFPCGENTQGQSCWWWSWFAWMAVSLWNIPTKASLNIIHDSGISSTCSHIMAAPEQLPYHALFSRWKLLLPPEGPYPRKIPPSQIQKGPQDPKSTNTWVGNSVCIGNVCFGASPRINEVDTGLIF